MTLPRITLCYATAADCRCGRVTGHAPPHECGEGLCGGQWTGEFGTVSFTIVRYPSAAELVLTREELIELAHLVRSFAAALGVTEMPEQDYQRYMELRDRLGGHWLR
jgi:hypothetical protein